MIQICRGLSEEGLAAPRGGGWTPATIKHILRCQTYIGKVVHRKSGQVLDGLHEGIVDRDLFDRCQRLLEMNSHAHPRSRGGSLSSLLWCGYCGGRVTLWKGKRGASYHCRNRVTSGHRHIPVYISQKTMEDYIWLVVEQLSDEAEAAFSDTFGRASTEPTTELAGLRDEQRVLEEQIRYNLRAAREAGLPMHLLAEENRGLQEQLAEVETEIRSLQEGIGYGGPTSLGVELEAIRQGSYEKQREFLWKVFRRVDVYAEKIVLWPVASYGEPLEIERQRFRKSGELELRVIG